MRFTRSGILMLLFLMLGFPAITEAQACSSYDTVWDADNPYFMTGATDADRHTELVDGITCANSYTESGTPTITLNYNITLDDSIVTSTYTNEIGNNAYPLLTGTLVIEGNDFTIERSDTTTEQFRFFQVGKISNLSPLTLEYGNLTLNNLTLRGGDQATAQGGGGAIAVLPESSATLTNASLLENSANDGSAILHLNDATLTITDSTISGNTGIGAIHNVTGNINITQTDISNNTGGGIMSLYGGDITIADSTITNNSGGIGGGINFDTNSANNADGILTITNSIISNNTSDSWGGGIYLGHGTMTLTNSIIANNTAATSGGIDVHGDAEIINTTIYNNTSVYSDYAAGGIFISAPAITLTNTIVAGSNNGGDVFNQNSGTITATGTNIISDYTLTGANIINGDPQLDENLVPIACSAAVDTADSSLLPAEFTTDVDGDTRIQGTTLDIGAQESGFTAGVDCDPIVLPICTNYNAAWDVDNPYLMTGVTNADRHTELVNGITCANSYTGSGTPTITLNADITLDDSIVTSPYPSDYGDSAYPNLTGTLVINGNNFTIERSENATERYRLFYIGWENLLEFDSGNLTLNDLTVRGGHPEHTTNQNADSIGGAIYVAYQSQLTLNNTTLTDNSAASSGSIFITTEGLVTITDSNITENTGNHIVYNMTDATLIVTNSDISNNNGTGILNFGTATVSNSVISHNEASPSQSGGGFSNAGDLTVINSIISNNISTEGGGLYNNWDGIVTIINSTIIENTATNIGGGLYNWSSETLTLTNSIVANNTSGGDISNIHSSTITATGTNIISDNTLTGVNIINGDPQLDGNLVPLECSVAVDAADASLLPAEFTTDVDGDARIQGVTLDIGAQESGVSAEYIDLYANGVTPSDATFVANRLGMDATGANRSADIDLDCDIDQDDLNQIIADLGTMP